MPEPTPLQAPQEPPEPDTDAEKKGEEEEDERFFVLNGDSYIDYPLRHFATWFDLVNPDAAALLVQSRDYSNKTLGLMEEQGQWINGGVYILTRELFSLGLALR